MRARIVLSSLAVLILGFLAVVACNDSIESSSAPRVLVAPAVDAGPQDADVDLVQPPEGVGTSPSKRSAK